MTVWEGTGGRFDLEEEAGAGGMGLVYRARDRQTGQPVAVKFLHGKSEVDAERFMHEAAVLRDLSHPAIVRYVAHGTTSAGAHYLAMEWLDGETLADRLRAQRLTVAESLALVRRMAEGLALAHRRGVVHRDLKPSNLFLVNGAVDSAKIIDFGIARRARGGDRLTRTGRVMGTPAYMAPEQARGSSDVDGRADLFALGCVLYECLAGEQAFIGVNTVAVHAKILLEDPPRLRDKLPGVPPSIDALLGRLLAKSRADRPRDAATLVAEIDAIGPVATGEAELVVSATASLTRRESRVVSIVLAGGVALRDEHEASWGPDTPAPSSPAPREGALRALVAPFGARLEPIVGGGIDRAAEPNGERGAARSRYIVVTLAGPAPSATEAATQAARCALALRNALPHAPMSLATGRGELGVRGPVGDVIDRATRVLGRGGDVIWLDEQTAALLDQRFDVDGAAGRQFLRGERELAHSSRHVLGRLTSFVGRDREMSALADLYTECATEPRARVVLVTGAAGVGKSRLRHEHLAWVASRAPTPEIMVARGDALAEGAPFFVLAPAIRRAAGIGPSDPLPARRAALAAHLGRVLTGDALARTTELLGEMIGVPVEAADASESLRAGRQDPVLLGDLVRAAFLDWLRAETRERPVVLAIDDLHWADVPSVKLVDAALRELADRPLFVLGFARPGVHDRFARLFADRGVLEVRLAELSRRAAEQLVRDVLGASAGPPLIARLVARADGNPFFLEELMRVADHHGELPETIVAVVQARLDALGGEAKRVLRAASVFGKSFTRGGVVALCGANVEAEWLDELVEQEVIFRQPSTLRGAETEFVFRHELLRDTAYAMLTDEDRALGHRLAGEWLERTGATDPVVLAEHFERGGLPARAIGWFARGSEQALEGNDLDGALVRARRGMECGAIGDARGALLRTQAEARFWRGEIAEAGALALQAARDLRPGTPLWFRAVEQILATAGRQGDYDRVTQWVGVVSSQSPEAGAESARITCLCRGVVPLIYAGRYDLADWLIGRLATDAAAKPLDRLTLARVHRVCAARAHHEGDAGTQLEEILAAFQGFLAGGDLRNACFERGMLGFAYADVGDYERAEDELRLALEAAQRMGLRTVVTATMHNLGRVLAHRGKLADARAVEEQAVRECAEQGNRRLEGGSRIYLSEILLLAEDVAAAEREARAAVELLTVAPPARAGALAVLARALGARRDATAQAVAAAREASALLESVGGGGEYESITRLALAEILHAANDPGAPEAIRRAADRLRVRAGRIKDLVVRQSFLHNVPDHARTLALEKML